MINSRVRENKVKNISYPKIMSAANGIIVLFEAPRAGTVLARPTSSKISYIGQYLTNWDMDCFTVFNGTIELDNSEI